MRLLGLIIVALTVVGCRPVGVEPPSGYRFPTEADYIGDWQVTSASKPPPIHVKADFNGDQLPDEAWILLSQSRPSWGLFVFLGTADGWSQAIQLDTDNGDVAPQSMGISLVPPGRYETACGKGYGSKCKPDEPGRLTTNKPSINFFLSESANSFFWWDDRAKAFRRTWMSD